MRPAETPVHDPIRISLTVIGFTLLFSVMTLCVKLATNEGVPVDNVMFWRFFFGLIPVLWYLNRHHAIRRELFNKEWQPLVSRAIMGLIAMWCTFQSFAMLPVAEATTLHFTSSILLTLLSIPVLGERVGVWRWGAIAMGFIGVLLVLRPEVSDAVAGQTIALCAACIMAMNMLLVRTLKDRVTPMALALYMHLVGTLIMLPLYMLNFHVPTLGGFFFLLLAGVSAGSAQLLLNYAFMHAPSGFVSAFSYIQIIFVALGGWLIFGDVPTQSFLWGAGIIVASGVVIAVRETLLRKKNPLEEAL